MDLKAIELGRFLSARRAQINPEQVGLPVGTRRRPGLRREEVAMLAGVGASWYQWIEQGRAKNVSREVLEAISCVLKLDTIEHRYMMSLAGVVGPERAEPQHDGLLIHQVVEGYQPNPAYVLDRYWNVVAANASALRLLGAHLTEGNYLRLLFTDPSFRELYIDWEQGAADEIARFRAHTGNRLGEQELTSLIEELRAESGTFARLWETRDVSDGSCTVQEMSHGELGQVSFSRITLDFTCHGGYRLVLLTPDQATRERIAACWEDRASKTVQSLEPAAADMRRRDDDTTSDLLEHPRARRPLDAPGQPHSDLSPGRRRPVGSSRMVARLDAR
ncbi:helix-turn-helix transcriptional regulator [Streptomyces sp. WELS2]|uniref:helix-turn-helix transcriptional regulator n=1 Tax=Streptomyces sp. WELS2 TaxID=2749435 RepID=UPI0015F09158|nr:helix-turn-helix transcriptional regulator [Streptomyces sp. WELS2]